MKTHLPMLKKIMIAVIVIATTISCAKKVQFQNSTVEPSAEGSVKIDKDNNENYAIDLSVLHLAEPERLTPPKKAYLLWMETAENGTKKIGQLKTTSGTLSRTMKSSLSSVTPFVPTSFFITAEDDVDTSLPGSVVVMKTPQIDW
jgi:hypothetical protein